MIDQTINIIAPSNSGLDSRCNVDLGIVVSLRYRRARELLAPMWCEVDTTYDGVVTGIQIRARIGDIAA